MANLNAQELKEITDGLRASLDAQRLFFESVRMDGGTLRVSGTFRIGGEPGNALPTGTTSVSTDVLPPGLYHIVSDTSGVFIDISSSPVARIDGSSYRLSADAPVAIRIEQGERLAAIVASGGAVVYYHRVR